MLMKTSAQENTIYIIDYVIVLDIDLINPINNLQMTKEPQE